MTKQEAIKILVECEKAPDWKYTEGMIREACQVLAGAPEDKPAEQPLDAVELAKVAIAMIELEKYRDLGTVEELRRVAEKMRKNDPLTLEELREMDGEPVWVTHKDGSGGRWGIVNIYPSGICADVCSRRAYWFADYIGTIAYRRRPEEVFG